MVLSRQAPSLEGTEVNQAGVAPPAISCWEFHGRRAAFRGEVQQGFKLGSNLDGAPPPTPVPPNAAPMVLISGLGSSPGPQQARS